MVGSNRNYTDRFAESANRGAIQVTTIKVQFMKKLTTSILACGVLASGLLSVGAASTMRVSPDGGATWVVIDDNGPLDMNPQVGVVRYDGPIGNWSLSISSGQTDPLIGTPAAPDMDLHTINFSSQPATLIVQYSETNLTTFPSETYINVVGYNTTGTVIQNSYRDSGNVLFGSTATYLSDPVGMSPSQTALLLSAVGPVSGANTISNGVVVLANGNSPNSLTIETIINHPGAGSTTVDTHLYTVPQPPCNCTLTYNSPSSITNCEGDAIPDVTASEDCGNGPVSVPVALVSATTNGACPFIITRNFTATNSCGTEYPFAQTVTVNCRPNCTITPSVTTVMAGTANLTAFVADAGAGATYTWTAANATITGGQGSRTITWTAGPDATKVATLCVTVTNATGCSSYCCTDVPLTPPCNCVLTFTSPSYITNCQGDIIPPVTATENCGRGAVSVPVTFVGASTNGSCPAIIVRTNSATDDCGDTQQFVQTIVVNCRGSICGHVFADCDGNGDLTAGDIGLSKVIVSLLDSGSHLLGTAMSDANGGYCFTNLAGGNYIVKVTPPFGYSQTAASTSYHWKDSYGRNCWQENDGNIHCLTSGTECWWDKTGTCHWKDSYNRDCWKDNWGGIHCQSLGYTSCNAPTNNNTICVTLGNCASQSDVDFAYTGSKPSLSVTCSGPSYVKCGQSYTYTCTVTNTGNVCFKGGNVCTTIGNCNYWGGWNSGCSNFNGNCPPLSPGQSCKFTVKCSFNSWNCGTVTCQSQVNCNHNYGTCSSQSYCYSQCGW